MLSTSIPFFARHLNGASRNARVWAPVNLDRLQHWISQGRLSCTPENPITARHLLLSGCIHDVHDGVKLLGNVSDNVYCRCAVSKFILQGATELKTAIHITPSRASHSAIKAVENLGGTIICKHYNPLALRDCVKDRTDRLAAAPTRREDISMLPSIWATVS